MSNTAFAAVVVGCCLIVAAFADDAMPENDGGRYTFSKVADNSCGSTPRPARFPSAASGRSAGPVRRCPKIAPCWRARSRGSAMKTRR